MDNSPGPGDFISESTSRGGFSVSQGRQAVLSWSQLWGPCLKIVGKIDRLLGVQLHRLEPFLKS